MHISRGWCALVAIVAAAGTIASEARAQDAGLQRVEDACRSELVAATVGTATTMKWAPQTRTLNLHLGTPELKIDLFGIKAKVPSFTLFDTQRTMFDGQLMSGGKMSRRTVTVKEQRLLLLQ